MAPLSTGQVLLVRGISPDESWWNVALPVDAGVDCWFPREVSAVSGDISSLKRDGNGKFSNGTYRSEPRRDNTILEKSSTLPGTEIHPVQQHHASLSIDNDVKMRLKLELARQFPR